MAGSRRVAGVPPAVFPIVAVASDPSEEQRTPPIRIAEGVVYRLTQAEASLAMAVLDGDQNVIGMNTARTQIKQVLAKLGLRRPERADPYSAAAAKAIVSLASLWLTNADFGQIVRSPRVLQQSRISRAGLCATVK